jgi:predicted nucleic acid-binding protein
MAIRPAAVANKPLKLEHDFEIKEHLFKNKRTGAMEPDMALFIDGMLHESTYTWGKRNVEASKPLRFDTLLELAKAYEDDIDESTALYLLTKQHGYKDLGRVLEQNHIKVSDFFDWVAENEEIQKVRTSSKGPGTRTTTDAVILATIINKMADMASEGETPDLQVRAAALISLVMNKETVDGAIEYLTEKLNDPKYGWDQDKKKMVKIKGEMKEITNPSHGQVRLKNRPTGTEPDAE